MTLTETRQSIIDLAKASTTNLVREVRAHRGQFRSLDEIKKIALRKTAVLVAYRGYQNAERHHDRFKANIVWVVYVLAQDIAGKDDRATLSSNISELLTGVFIRELGNLEAAQDEPLRMSANNVTTLPIDKTGIALWEITWTQSMTFLPDDLATVLNDFEGIDIDHFDTDADTQVDAPLAQTTVTN